MARWAAWVARAQLLKRDAVAIYLAARDPRTPILAKLIVVALIAYVLSPIDLIPDFIPVLGLLDELILVPLVIGIALRMIPAEVIDEARARAPAAARRVRRLALVGAGAVIVIWIVVLWFAVSAILALFREVR